MALGRNPGLSLPRGLFLTFRIPSYWLWGVAGGFVLCVLLTRTFAEEGSICVEEQSLPVQRCVWVVGSSLSSEDHKMLDEDGDGQGLHVKQSPWRLKTIEWWREDTQGTESQLYKITEDQVTLTVPANRHSTYSVPGAVVSPWCKWAHWSCSHPRKETLISPICQRGRLSVEIVSRPRAQWELGDVAFRLKQDNPEATLLISGLSRIFGNSSFLMLQMPGNCLGVLLVPVLCFTSWQGHLWLLLSFNEDSALCRHIFFPRPDFCLRILKLCKFTYMSGKELHSGFSNLWWEIKWQICNAYYRLHFRVNSGHKQGIPCLYPFPMQLGETIAF